jgi:NAD(P)-dependent dehydrogenase (short-subunit alcohol dehydrogenase family)
MSGTKPQVVVITGASAGVGRATARALARRGAWIGLLARGRAGLEGARRDVEALGGRAITVRTDVGDAAAVEAAAAVVEQELGEIDVWINNAMNSVFSPVKEMTAEEYRRVTEVSYLGYVHGVIAALRRMLPRDRGVIVNVGSALAYRGIPLQSAYCAAKHAIQGFTESLRTELLHDGSNVRVTEVHLPAINTPQFRWVKSRLPLKAQPVPPIFQPEIAADAICFAIDNPRRELWVGWPAIRTILGNRVAPWYLDRRLASEGFSGQQIQGEPYEERPHNLWDPVDEDEDYGARGVFDDRSTESSPQLWLSKHRRLLGALGMGVAGAAGAVIGTLAVRSGNGLNAIRDRG